MGGRAALKVFDRQVIPSMGVLPVDICQLPVRGPAPADLMEMQVKELKLAEKLGSGRAWPRTAPQGSHWGREFSSEDPP